MKKIRDRVLSLLCEQPLTVVEMSEMLRVSRNSVEEHVRGLARVKRIRRHGLQRVPVGRARTIWTAALAWNDTLIAVVERGPLADGDIPSKRQREELITAGLCVRVIAGGEDGFTAATYDGAEAYCQMFETRTLDEGRARRIVISQLAKQAAP
jgi:hypothetical protein